MWFATRYGVAKLNQADSTFKRYKTDPSKDWADQNNRVRVLYQDKQGTIWATSGEFYVARLESGLSQSQWYSTL